MTRSLFALVGAALLAIGVASYSTAARRAPAPPVERIAFGSCNKQYVAQPLWEPIRAHNPDLWVWLGDNIYADTEDMAAMQAKYKQQRQNAGYAALRQETTVIGTWDDHDYGLNDAGREYAKRDSSQHLFLDFLGVPADSPRRLRRGVYSAHTYGPSGQRVKVILLDTRYHRDPLTPDSTTEQRYYPNAEGDILGQAQWTWLEDELRRSDAQVHLIGTSIQAIAEEHPWEKWSNFPKARQRLFEVIRRSGTPGVVLLSGDRHKSELARLDDAIGYPLYELTASGLTHHAPPGPEPNRHRVGSLVVDENFGLVSIDWNAEPTTLSLQIRGSDNQVLIDHRVSLPDLRPAS
jgi:alkaline phosphatase D